MIYRETKRCSICGELYPLHQLDKVFTGRTQLICYKCQKNGLEDTGVRLHKHKIRKEQQGK